MWCVFINLLHYFQVVIPVKYVVLHQGIGLVEKPLRVSVIKEWVFNHVVRRLPNPYLLPRVVGF